MSEDSEVLLIIHTINKTIQYQTMSTTRTIYTSSIPSNLGRLARSNFAPHSIKYGLPSIYSGLNARHFSSGYRRNIEFFPPARDTPNIKETKAAWPHESVTDKQLNSVEAFVHRDRRTISDKVAFGMGKSYPSYIIFPSQMSCSAISYSMTDVFLQ